MNSVAIFWIWHLQKVGDGNPLVCLMLGFTINPPVCTNRWRHTRHIAHMFICLAWPKGMITRAQRLCSARSMFHLEVSHLKRLLAARFGTPYADHILKPIPKHPPSVASHEYLTSRLIIPYHSAWELSRFRSILRKVQSRYHASCLDARHGCFHTNPSLIRTGCSPFTCTSC